ncbi:ricin-type beta-trefoil lectin domain protein [Streptomyces sp. BI20]|uniref:ricin-type beta-trefoil lectin domain protein n=1 Tax=Streptomyces sp. BI20 TaxID=3403460 RepID=UPI003C770B44
MSPRPRRPRALVGLLSAAALAAGLLPAAPALAEPTATSDLPLALRPPQGWNNWAHYMCEIDEATVVANADALVSTGLAAKGYDTVTVDDCWTTKSRDANGDLVTDGAKFPRGMAWLGRYLHGKGLRFGIYQDAGHLTCERYPGSGTPVGGGPDNFDRDARLFASWEVDYVKMDGCNVWVPPGQTKEQAYRDAYTKVARALKATGRPMVLSASAPAYFQAGEYGGPDWHKVIGWVRETGQLWREGRDIKVYAPKAPDTSRWASVLGNYGYNRWLARHSGPGNWNDPDFLLAGAPGLTEEEGRSQVALWAMMAAPFILSSDVTKLSAAGLAALKNDDLLALDQDPLGRQAAVISSDGTLDVLARPLSGGERAVAVLNRSNSAKEVGVPLTDIGLSGCAVAAKDLWTGATTRVETRLSAKVPAHGTAVWRLTGLNCGKAVPTGQIVGAGVTCVDGRHPGEAGTAAMSACAGTSDQRWQVRADGSLRLLGSCLTAGEAGAVTLAACAPGLPGQRWTYRRDGALVERVDGRCLEAPAPVKAPAAPGPLRLVPCGDHVTAQTWSLPV